MTDKNLCPDGETCPRVFQTTDGNVIVQGYMVLGQDIPGAASPPNGEWQVRMPRESFLEFARQVRDQDPPRQGHLLDGARRSIFRLEAQAGYGPEDPRWDDFRDGRPLPPRTPENSPWLRRVAETTAVGVVWSRVHVVRELTDYQRFELLELRANERVGEAVTVVDAAALGVHDRELRDDFWLIDETEGPSARAVLMRYARDGRFTGAWQATDKAALAECRRLRALATQLSEPLEDYLARTGLSERRATA